MPAAPKRAKQKPPALTRWAGPVGLLRVMLAVLAVALLSLGGTATAQAGGSANGLLTFTPAKGKDTTPMYFVTSRPCPAQATNVLATAYGHGFTASGQIVVSNSTSGMSHTSPFVLPLQDTMAAYAKRLNITLAGPYQVVLICKSRLSMTPYATMVGTITFHAPHDYTAPAVTPAQVAAVTGQAGAQADGQLPSTGPLGAPGSPATARPLAGSTPPSSSATPGPGQPGIPASPGSAGAAPGPSAGASAAAMAPTSATRSTAPSMWWLSIAGVLLLLVGVVLALRSVQGPSSPGQAGAPAQTEPSLERDPERVS